MVFVPLDTGLKQIVHNKTFRRRQRLLYIQFTFCVEKVGGLYKICHECVWPLCEVEAERINNLIYSFNS